MLGKVTTGGYFHVMKAVGVKVLKAKLSEYLRLVKAGETLLVTERDEVVAELRPAHRQPIALSTLEDGLEAMAERGAATLASQPVGELKGFRVKVDLGGLTIDQVLDELREERPLA